MSFFISEAYAEAAPAAAGAAGTGFEWVFLVGFLVIFYLMIWRPQAKQAKGQALTKPETEAVEQPAER